MLIVLIVLIVGHIRFFAHIGDEPQAREGTHKRSSRKLVSGRLIATRPVPTHSRRHTPIMALSMNMGTHGFDHIAASLHIPVNTNTAAPRSQARGEGAGAMSNTRYQEHNEQAPKAEAEDTIGDRLGKLRDRAGLTTYELSKAAGVSNAYIIKLERGDVHRPSIEYLMRVAHALGVSLDQLIGTEELPGGESVLISGISRDEAATARRLVHVVRHLQVEDVPSFLVHLSALPADEQHMFARLVRLAALDHRARQRARQMRNVAERMAMDRADDEELVVGEEGQEGTDHGQETRQR